ncbi:MAG TPA: glycosyltransferase family 2 protein [Ignavibacteria bacterium]|nr:glycosyltransferase family 2 protein [Ignavibacteria bacterium]
MKAKDKNINIKESMLNKLPEPPEGKKGWPWTEETETRIYENIKSFPKISIVTPSYNQGKFIEQTIRSVLLQNYPNLEYIIIDGGSTDETSDIINKYKQWLKYYVSEKDRGQTHAINKGIRKCEGEIFNWLNSDDFYNKSCFKFLAENFLDRETEVVSGKYRFFYEDGSKEKIIDLKMRNTLEESIALVAVNQPSTFFRMDIVKSLGELDERLNYLMDQDIWKKYLFKYGQEKIKIIKEVIVSFRFHTGSKTSQFKFINEHMGIFYSIADKAGMIKHMELMKTIYGRDIISEYDFRMIFSNNDLILAKKVVNSLFLFNARSSYTEGNIKQLDLWLKTLESKWLNEKQKNDLRTLKVKSKLLKYKLEPVIKFINSRNSKAKNKSMKKDPVPEM